MPTSNRAFVSSSRFASTDRLAAGLAAAGYSTFNLFDVAEFGSSYSAAVREAVKSADLFVIVLDNDNSANALFEAGLAAAFQLPVVVVALDGVLIPTPLTSAPVIRILDVELIAQAARSAVRSRPPVASSGPRGKALGSLADDLVQRVSQVSDAQVIDVLADAIEESGAIVVRGGTKGFDLAVWSDDLISLAANPVLIEFKTQVGPHTLEDVAASLGASGGSGVAIVVYRLDSESRVRAEAAAGPKYPVLFAALDDFIISMRNDSFARIVRDLRNRASHDRRS